MDSPKIDLNPQFQQALTMLEHSSNHAFITGRAGTGKSTLLDFFRKRTDKNIAVLAPTGVAALNVEGETIHSFFRFKPGLTVDEAKQELEEFRKAMARSTNEKLTLFRGYVQDTRLCRAPDKHVYPAHQIMPRASLSTAFYPRIITCSRLSCAP
jgi:hypothetical protein